MAKKQFRIIDTAKGILNTVPENFYEVGGEEVDYDINRTGVNNTVNNLFDLVLTKDAVTKTTLTLIQPTGLEAIDEGNGVGWRLIGRDPANYGNIGENAIDLGYSNGASTTIGALGIYSSVLGGLNNTTNGAYASVAGGEDNSSGFASFIGAGEDNIALWYGFIGAGRSNTMTGSAQYSGIVAGGYNTISAGTQYGFIGAGSSNVIGGSSNMGIVAGNLNTIQGGGSVIGGGSSNNIIASSGFIGAGNINLIGNGSSYSFIGSGTRNEIISDGSTGYSPYSFIGGGAFNQIIFGQESGILSGNANKVLVAQGGIVAGSGNTVEGYKSVILGGENNTIEASGQDSAILNGASNSASGPFSLVSGLYNVAPSRAESVFGSFATEYTPIDNISFNLLDRLFTIGNGTSTGVNRSDAFMILKNGTITAPSLTNALITTAGNKALVTKEYADANYLGSGVIDHTALSNIGINTHTQIDSHIADTSIHFTQASISIAESQISDLQSYLTVETDPVFVASQANNITSQHITDLNNLSGTNTGDQDLSGLVPYTGATSNVDLGVNNILANALQLVNGTEINWNTKYHTINVPTGDGAVTKVGLDTMFDIHNATGVPLLKGQVVYPDGTSTGGISNVQLCLANNHETINTLIGIIPFDIPNGSDGHVMVQGVIDPIDTSGLSEGPVYLSSTVLGGLTNTKPEFPNYAVLVGVVDSSAVSGVITVDTSYDVENTITQAWDGSFRESIDCLVSSNGTTITASLERKGGGDLTMMFSDGFTILDCTPAQTIALTPGTDIAPQVNYVYISKATKALVVSTSGFPSDEHIKVADIVVQSASGTQTNGALVNRNWNDHIKSVGDNGHLLHITERLRQNHAEWNSGILGSSTVSAPTLSNVYVSTTGGTVYQLHKQSFPVFNTTTGDDIHIVNHSTTPYTTVSNLNGQTTDSLGVSLANHSFSFVLWGVQNKTGENCHLMINLPKGSYAKNTPEDAVADAFNYSVYDIPKNFKGKGFLIARFTYVVEPNGTSWSLFDTEDLRGKVPNSAAGSFGGGGAGGVTEFDALTDTPSTKIGQALKLLRVGSGETAIEYETIENILPSNIAKTDVSNLFTEKQNIYETTSDTVLQLRSNLRTYVGVGFRESSGVGSDMGFIGIKRTDAPTASDSELHFRHAKSGVVSTSMMIDTTGNVGIGTEIPEAFLHVNGVNAGDFGALFQNSSSGAYVNNQFKNDLGNAGYIGIGGSTLAEGFASRLYLDTFNSNGISVLTEVGDLRFYYGGAAAINETVRLTENGTLEIGNSVVGTSGASIGGLLVEGTINGSNLSGTNTGDQDISGIGTNATNLSNHISSHPAPTIRDARNQIAGTYSTDIHTNITALNAVTGTNTGDNAVNTLYSGLADTSEWASYTGTIAAEDLIVKMGDHQNLVNGTGITIDLDNETVVVVGNFSATNISGANSGDNAVNTLYSGLVTNATHTGEVTGSGVLTIASDVIDIDNLASELKATTSLGNVSGTVTLNQSLGIQFNMTLTAASTIALTNPVQGKMITAIITGDFTLAVPASVKGDISAFDGAKTNQLQFYCLDSTTPLYSVTLLNW